MSEPLTLWESALLSAHAEELFHAAEAIVREDDRMIAEDDCFTNIGDLIAQARKIVHLVRGPTLAPHPLSPLSDDNR